MFVGIDIGTGSVRSYTLTGHSHTADIHTTKHPNTITQSSRQIFHSITKVLPSADLQGICFTATCSMVVREKQVNGSGQPVLAPFDCAAGPSHGPSSSNFSQDVILWMDTRSASQCEYLNQMKEHSFMKSTITTFVPELGVPKLKWLSDTYPDKQLVCFELYDWFSYLFQVGYCGEDLVLDKLTKVGYKEGNAIDGSIKGWTQTDLDFVNGNISVGQSETVLHRPEKLPKLGDYIGPVALSLGLGPCQIYNGCIDCYAGWICTVTDTPRSISMIAGTSTCFVMQTGSLDLKPPPIPGIWGPFELVQNGKFVYSFGQPATGKLFEDLFEEYQLKTTENPFEMLETATVELETKFKKPITEIIKHYYYYGDKYGNRNPLMNFTMNETYIDGKNSSEIGVSIYSNTKDTLTIKYNLIMEFLSFQTAQMLQPLAVESIVVSGSQGKNHRFLRLLGAVTKKQIYVIEGNQSLNVAKGAMTLAKGVLASPEPAPIHHKLEFQVSAEESRVLNAKKAVLDSVIALQLQLAAI